MAVNLEYVFRETASNLKRNLSMASAALLTVAVSLTLVGGALLVKRGVDRATVQWKGNVELSIFMKADASAPESEAIDRQLKGMPEVKSYRYVSKPEAFEEFKQFLVTGADVTGTGILLLMVGVVVGTVGSALAVSRFLDV